MHIMEGVDSILEVHRQRRINKDFLLVAAQDFGIRRPSPVSKWRLLSTSRGNKTGLEALLPDDDNFSKVLPVGEEKKKWKKKQRNKGIFIR